MERMEGSAVVLEVEVELTTSTSHETASHLTSPSVGPSSSVGDRPGDVGFNDRVVLDGGVPLLSFVRGT